jgi:catechol 2,3-dioxygenase-like lactoylglutathione lyase family enzyme
MFSHLMIGTNDIDRAKTFYDATFAAFGGPKGFIDPKGRLIYAQRRHLHSHQADRWRTGHCANGFTVGFAMTPEQADAWHAAGLANGGALRRPAGRAQGNALLPRLSARSRWPQDLRPAQLWRSAMTLETVSTSKAHGGGWASTSTPPRRRRRR